MNRLAHWKAEPPRVWGTATWQNIADSVLPVVGKEHVARLAPRPGNRWLDVAAGTEAVALPAALARAEVSALDLPPALVRTARRLAAKQESLSRLAAVRRGTGAGQDRIRGLVAHQTRDRYARLVGYFERHRRDGTVRVPRPYLLIPGRGRAGGRG
jgi:hypothetical protein